MRQHIKPLSALLPLFLLISNLWAKGIYQQPIDFVNQQFEQATPAAQVIWIKDKIRNEVESILGHSYQGRRIRFWREASRSVWVLNEIGKVKPITIGIVIEQGRVTIFKVLIFRESRGWEVRYPFFTRQFIDAGLTESNRLSHNIDGITGATLSVRALRKLARVALYLDQATKQI